MENRHGLVVGGAATLARHPGEAALTRIDGRRRRRRVTLGADKAYNVADFVASLQARSVSPHIAIDGHVRVTGKPRKTSVRWPSYPPPWLRDQSTLPQADRGGVRLDQGVGGTGQDQAVRPRAYQCHLGLSGLQSHPAAQAPGSSMSIRASGDGKIGRASCRERVLRLV